MISQEPAIFSDNKYCVSIEIIFLRVEEQNSIYLFNFRHCCFSLKHMTCHSFIDNISERRHNNLPVCIMYIWYWSHVFTAIASRRHAKKKLPVRLEIL